MGNLHTAALVGMNVSIELARVFSTPTYFWKVPDKHDFECSYDNEYILPNLEWPWPILADD